MNLLGIVLVVAFCIYAISRVRAMPAETDKHLKRKAIIFYFLISGALLAYFVISYFVQANTPMEFN